jgi:hypothetical protein
LKLRAALRDKKNTELYAVAQLLRTAQHVERDADLEVLSIPAADIFFLLDGDVIRELYPQYPGHEEAQAACREAARVAGHGVKWKDFFENEFGVPSDLTLHERVSARMRDRGMVPEEVRGLVEQLAEWSD